MGLFNRGTRNGAATTTADPSHANDGVRTQRKGFFGGSGAKSGAGHDGGHRQRHGSLGNDGLENRRPTFGQWLKATWVDILTMIAMGLVGLGVYEAHPAASRSFPVSFADGEIVYPQFAYPIRKEVVPIWAAAMLGSMIPILFIFLAQIRVRSFWDVNNGVLGVLYSLITAAVFQVFLKWLIGGLRPHFLAACQPKIPEGVVGNGFQNVMFDRSICTGDLDTIDDSLESFPSGHSTAAFAGFVFLSLYLNGKLKTFSNYHPAMWKLLLTWAPILGATLIAGALTIDEFHNWYDCLAGAIIGTVMAFSSYRMVYAAVWDFRFNHIPLTRHAPFHYGHSGWGGFETAVWTRRAGWGSLEGGGVGGAPFDASTHGGSGGIGSGGIGSGGIGSGGTGTAGVLGTGHGAETGHHHGHRASDSHGSHTIERKPVGTAPHGDNMV